MRNFYKNDLMDETLVRFYQTFSIMLDTTDFCPEKYNNKIRKIIFKDMKKAFRKDAKTNKQYQKTLNKIEKKQKRQAFILKVKEKFKLLKNKRL